MTSCFVCRSLILGSEFLCYCNHSELYKEEGIKLNEDWLEEIGERETDYITQEKSNSEQTQDIETQEDSDNEWIEVTEENAPIGNRDTLLQNNDFTDDGKHALKIAPGQNNHPVSLYVDEFAEEKAFPVLFAGQKRPENNIPVSYATICKAELRSADRRFASSVPNIFFKLKKLQTLQVKNSILTALRKLKGKDQKYTAKDVLDESVLQNIINQNEGYQILRSLRSSPPFFQQKQRELFATIKQLGVPTFFATFSAAETHWCDLLQILWRKSRGSEISVEEVKKISYMEKSNLIQNNPVACARHFQYRTNLFFNNIMKTSASPIGKVTDLYYRVEFQQRGSPHLHCLFWVENSPKYGESSEDDIIQFIDKYITCAKSPQKQIEDLVPLQSHRHTKTCKKKGKRECRFGFPIPPMDTTCILQPLPKDLDKKERQRNKDNYNKIQEVLKSLDDKNDMSFEQFLLRCSLSKEEYVTAIRSSLTRTQIFLIRDPSEIRINPYNPLILHTWKANTDLQFILDPWAVCVYISSYMMKSQRGISQLLQTASEEVKRGNKSVKEKLRFISNKFLNHCEISAQEAIYLLLQMPLTQSSRDVVFVNTSEPEKRISILKSKSLLKSLPKQSTEITFAGPLDHYAERPKELENLTLADFCSYFELRARGKKAVDFDFTDNPVEEIVAGTQIPLENGKVLVKRLTPKIIRPVGFKHSIDAEKFYREQILLYTSWRDESQIKTDSETYRDRYVSLQNHIESVRHKYNKCGEEFEAAIESMNEEMILESMDTIAPQDRQLSEEAISEVEDSSLFNSLQPPTEDLAKFDIGPEIGITSIETQTVQAQIPDRLSNEDFYTMMRTLNNEQATFVNHIVHLHKTCKLPYYVFLTGGAGVGKSHVVRAIFQSLSRYYDTQPGNSPDEPKVMIVAPTGRAAYHVHGNTIHSLLSIPPNKSLKVYKPLQQSERNRLRVLFGKVELLIVDEVSMVGANMFKYMDLRLQEIFYCNRDFGGLSLLLVGDLYQLRPVADKWIFQIPSTPYENLAPTKWLEIVKLYELKEIMRQKDDATFGGLLNRLREQKQTKSDVELLQKRIKNSQHIDPKVQHLFCKNELVEAHNQKILGQLDTPSCLSRAKDSLDGNIPENKKKELLQEVKQYLPQQTQNLQHELLVKVGGQYMIVHNLDTSDGLTNGVPCTVVHFSLSNSGLPIVWVKFEDTSIASILRTNSKELYLKGINKAWTPIKQVTKQFQLQCQKHLIVTRKQFPLRPCFAITIHKSQGSTLNEAVISFKGLFAPHTVYVALSRVTNIHSVYLLDFDEKQIKVDHDVVVEMERLRQNCALCLTQSLTLQPNKLLIMLNNCRSILKHRQDIATYLPFAEADVLVFQETFLKNSDRFSLEDFVVLERNDTTILNHKRHAGSMIMAKDFIRYEHIFSLNENGIEVIVGRAAKMQDTFNILTVYKNPAKDLSILEKHLHTALSQIPTNQHLIVLGDFNEDFLQPSPKFLHFQEMLKSGYGLELVIDIETTDYHSGLDHIYSNIHNLKTGVCESYWSDHKVLWMAVV